MKFLKKWSEKGYEIDKTEGYRGGYRTGRGGKESSPTLKDENIYNDWYKQGYEDEYVRGYNDGWRKISPILTLHGNG